MEKNLQCMGVGYRVEISSRHHSWYFLHTPNKIMRLFLSIKQNILLKLMFTNVIRSINVYNHYFTKVLISKLAGAHRWPSALNGDDKKFREDEHKTNCLFFLMSTFLGSMIITDKYSFKVINFGLTLTVRISQSVQTYRIYEHTGTKVCKRGQLY